MVPIGEPPVFNKLPPPGEYAMGAFIRPECLSLVGYLLEYAPDAIVMFDNEWRQIYANKTWEKITSLNRLEQKGVRLWDYAPQLIGTEVEKYYREAMSRQEMCSFTIRHPILNRYTMTYCFPTPTSICLLMKDISDIIQKTEEVLQFQLELESRVEQRTYELRKAQEFNDRVIREAVDGIIGFNNTNMEVFAWNPTMEKITGIKQETAIGRSLIDIFPQYSHHTARSVIDRIFKGESIIFRGSSVVDLENQPPEMQVFMGPNFERYCVPLAGDKPGEIVGAVIYFKNVSAQNEIQLQLSKARDEALNLAKAKSAFLANMSHEIRTPLNAIIGLTDLLKESHLDKQQQEYFDIMQASALSLLTIVNQVLDFSKYEVGKMSFIEENFSLAEVINSTGGVFKRDAESKGLSIRWKINDGLENSTLIGDSERLRQILVNLVNNSLKFTSKGFVSITLNKDNASEEEKGLLWVALEVQDTGIGMSADTLKVLFSPFTQADASTTRIYGGTGLGLAIVKQIVDCMGGTVTVSSQIDVGSRFYVRIPYKLMKKQPPGCTAPAPPDKNNPKPTRPKRRNSTAEYHLSDTFDPKQFTSNSNIAAQNSTTTSDQNFSVKMSNSNTLSYSPSFSPNISPSLIHGTSSSPLRNTGTATSSPAPRNPPPTPTGRSHHIQPSTSSLQISTSTSTSSYASLPSPTSSRLPTMTSLPNFATNFQKDEMGAPPLKRRRAVSVESYSELAAKPTTPHILVVEDNEVNQKVLSFLLKRLNTTADMCTNGREAIDFLLSNPFKYDLVIMDVQMPVMDGYTAAMEIRKHNSLSHIPIIAMTANAMPGDRERCLTSGMDDYIAKPINMKVLGPLLQLWSNKSKR